MINQRILRMDLPEQRTHKYELLFLNEAEKAFEPSQSLVFLLSAITFMSRTISERRTGLHSYGSRVNNFLFLILHRRLTHAYRVCVVTCLSVPSWLAGKGFQVRLSCDTLNQSVALLKHFLRRVNPSHPNISMYILHTFLRTFPKRLTRRICLTIKSCFSWWSSPLFSWLSCLFQEWYCNGFKALRLWRKCFNVIN